MVGPVRTAMWEPGESVIPVSMVTVSAMRRLVMSPVRMVRVSRDLGKDFGSYPSDLGEESLHKALPAVTRLGLLAVPRIYIPKVLFFQRYELLDVGRVLSQSLQLGELGVQPISCRFLRAIDSIPVNLGYPDRSDLLEDDSETEILDYRTIHRIDDEVKKLFPRSVVPHDTIRAPSGIDGCPRIVGERAATFLRKGLAV